MCYEFWGMLEVPGGASHMRDVARRFAEAGYVAIVPDYYATRGEQPMMEGGTIQGGPSDDDAGRDLCDAVNWLQSQSYVQPDRIGVIGWCGGGRQAAQHGVPHEIHYYAGAGHAFMNNERDSFHETAARESWRDVLRFFERQLNPVAATA